MIDCFLSINCGGIGGCEGTVITEDNFASNIEFAIKYCSFLLLTILLHWKIKQFGNFLNNLNTLSH